MGNCQAIDAATLVIQHPCGKVDKLYWPVTASEIMKMKPGHYVALLITTTLYHSNNHTTDNTTRDMNKSNQHKINNNGNRSREIGKNPYSTCSSNSPSNANDSVRVTRLKLLRPTDSLALGHVYRLISTQEVMKGLVAKKQGKLRKKGIELADKEEAVKDVERAARRYQLDKSHLQVNTLERNRSRTASGSTNGGKAKPRTWQPSLQSISEGGS